MSDLGISRCLWLLLIDPGQLPYVKKMRPLFVHFHSFQAIHRIKTTDLSGIRNLIVGVEGKHADHLTTSRNFHLFTVSVLWSPTLKFALALHEVLVYWCAPTYWTLACVQWPIRQLLPIPSLFLIDVYVIKILKHLGIVVDSLKGS